MNYYEELGLTPEATPDEIHQAHRKLTKLLHPDQQTDEVLRRLAETQMRRLNSIVDVLSDKDSRKQYDKGVNTPVDRPRHNQAPNQTSTAMAVPTRDARADPRQVLTTIWRSLPWWVWSTVGALTLTSAAVWFFADNLGSSFGGNTMAYVPVQDQPAQSGASATASPENRESQGSARLQQLTARLRAVFEPNSDQSKRKASTASQAKGQSSHGDPAPAPGQSPPSDEAPQPPPPAPLNPRPSSHSDSTHDTAATLARATPPKIDGAQVNTAPPVVQPPNLTKPLPAPAQPAPAVTSQNAPAATAISGTPSTNESAAILPSPSGLEGDWIYAPKKPEKRKPGLYPPAYIEMKLFRSQGALRGSYRARYQVDESRQISPDVSFQLSSEQENTKTLSWEGDNGSKGWLKVNPVDKYTIKVEWKTTVYSNQPGLTAGVATLVRR